MNRQTSATGLSAEAASLGARGRALDALDRLRTAPIERDPAAARRLVQLRHAAFQELVRARGPSAGAPAPTPGRQALTIEPPPGMALDQLTPARIREQMHRHGCVLVRSLVPPQTVARLVETIDQAFAACDAFLEKRAGRTGWFDPILKIAGGMLTRRWTRDAGGVLAADSPFGLETLIRTYAELGIGRLVANYFGERPAISADKATLRRTQVTAETEWHQDGRFLGTGIRSLNVWVTLTDCGVEAPGLDIVPVYPDRILETGTGSATYDWTIDHGLIVREYGAAAIWCPTFRAGDALLFDHMLVHRTGYHPSMTRSRHALETWFFAPSAYPAAQTPLLV